MKPSLETLRDLIRACGLELTLGLANYDDSYLSLIASQLALSPAERVAHMEQVAASQLELRGDGPVPRPEPPYDASAIIATLQESRVRERRRRCGHCAWLALPASISRQPFAQWVARALASRRSSEPGRRSRLSDRTSDAHRKCRLDADAGAFDLRFEPRRSSTATP